MQQEKRRKTDFELPPLVDLFSNEEMRQDAKLPRIREIPLKEIDDFPDHPFQVRDDEDMMQLVESIKEKGVLYTIDSSKGHLYTLEQAEKLLNE